jgi:hypothetical protein
MGSIDEFLHKLFNGKNTKECFNDFVKYYNKEYEVLVYDNKVLVTDKRSKKINIYNNLQIAKTRLLINTPSA